jgi:Anti-sigma factor NepR
MAEGRGTQPEDPSGPALNDNIQEQIGAKLKALFDQVVEQPVPDRFVELLQALEDKEEGADDSGREFS